MAQQQWAAPPNPVQGQAYGPTAESFTPTEGAGSPLGTAWTGTKSQGLRGLVALVEQAGQEAPGAQRRP